MLTFFCCCSKFFFYCCCFSFLKQHSHCVNASYCSSKVCVQFTANPTYKKFGTLGPRSTKRQHSETNTLPMQSVLNELNRTLVSPSQNWIYNQCACFVAVGIDTSTHTQIVDTIIALDDLMSINVSTQLPPVSLWSWRNRNKTE